MKNIVWFRFLIVLAAALTLFGTGYAGWFGSDEKQGSETQVLGAGSEKEAMSHPDQVTLSGTINESSQLVDDHGKEFRLADTDEGRQLKALIGKKVEITGTLMEDAGENVVEVREYKILKE